MDPRTLTPLSVDDEADDEDQETSSLSSAQLHDLTGEGAAAEEGETPGSAMSEWATLYAVLYKTQLMLCNEEGGDVQHSLALWAVFPTSVRLRPYASCRFQSCRCAHMSSWCSRVYLTWVDE